MFFLPSIQTSKHSIPKSSYLSIIIIIYRKSVIFVVGGGSRHVSQVNVCNSSTSAVMVWVAYKVC